jgi:hypothetical protein
MIFSLRIPLPAPAFWDGDAPTRTIFTQSDIPSGSPPIRLIRLIRQSAFFSSPR